MSTKPTALAWRMPRGSNTPLLAAGYLITAGVNVIKFRRHGSPVLSAAKVISLVSAMVSILSLETAMVTRFGDEDDFLFRRVMTGATGGGVCILVLGIAVFMIIKSSLQLKKLATVQNQGNT